MDYILIDNYSNVKLLCKYFGVPLFSNQWIMYKSSFFSVKMIDQNCSKGLKDTNFLRISDRNGRPSPSSNRPEKVRVRAACLGRSGFRALRAIEDLSEKIINSKLSDWNSRQFFGPIVTTGEDITFNIQSMDRDYNTNTRIFESHLYVRVLPQIHLHSSLLV